MKFEGVRRSSDVPNLTPLIDIVFLLLVFFLLTAHFVRDEGIAIQLPEAESAVASDDDLLVEVLVDAEGRIHLDKQEVPSDQLERRIRVALDGKEKKWVTLRGDRGTQLQIVVSVLDAARRAGAESVDVVTEKP